MSYILDALTRSQKQRERSVIPTLTTAYLGNQARESHFNVWQVVALLGLGLFAALIAVHSLSDRPLLHTVLDKAPSATPLPPSMASTGAARSSVAAVPVNSAPSTGPDTAHVSLALPRSRQSRVDHAPARAAAVDSMEPTGEQSTTPGPAMSKAPAANAIERVQWSEKAAHQRLSPETRRLVDEMMVLHRAEEGRELPRNRAPSNAARGQKAVTVQAGDEVIAPSAEHHVGAPGQLPKSGTTGALPTLGELPPETRAAISPLEVNVHAYAKDVAERMVIINMKTYGEGDRLKEGPLIDAITPTGVVLSFDNRRFRLAAR